MDLKRELAVATDAARGAGDLIRSFYGGKIVAREKSEGNPVTDADLAADAHIRTIVADAFPEDGWISEETADSHERLHRRRVWIVDPLDGTKQFIGKIPEFCVSIGLVEDGHPVLGVAYNPVRDELFCGAAGWGSRFNGEPVRVSAVANLKAARVLASRSEDARGEWDAYKRILRVEPTGSVAYKLALVAAGRGDATFSLTPKNEWDICAGVALIEASGGRVTDCDGRELRFNQPRTVLPGLIASNGALHGAIEELIRAREKDAS